MEKVVIIGSGCAGLTAAIYTARASLEPLVLTGAMPGGLLTTTSIVENYPGFAKGIDGTELMMEMQQQAERFGARIQFGSAVDAIDFSGSPLKLTVDGNEVETQTVVIASGAGHRHLGLESEAALEKKGVTYCATCDGALPMFRDQPLVVVGGGDSACEEATYLTRFASKVYLVHRRDELRASKIMAKRALEHEKIEMLWDSAVEEVLADEDGKCNGVRTKNLKTDDVGEIVCKGVFIAIGHIPNTGFLEGHLSLDDQGYILPEANSMVRTKIPGVYTAGDCADHVYRQAITAAGMGCQSAIEAERWLAEQD